MSRLPKFSVFRMPLHSKQTNGDRLRLSSPSNGDVEKERKINIKLAWFFGVGALLFVLADYFGRVKDETDANRIPESTAHVSVTVSPPVRSKEGTGFSVRFRLSNKGNQTIFYPVSRTTNMRIGQLVARTSSSSEWMTMSDTMRQHVPAEQEFTDPNLLWIEMPPGGWMDGEFRDPGDFPGEHAYVIYIKTARDGRGTTIVSNPYSLPAD